MSLCSWYIWVDNVLYSFKFHVEHELNLKPCLSIGKAIFMKEKKLYLITKDYSVSGEEFQLRYNNEFEMLETYPQPNQEKLPLYYKSDDYISHTGSKRNIFEKVYHFVKIFSIKRKLRLLKNVSPEGKRLLDVGCGTGDFLKSAYKNKWDIAGIEPNINARKLANLKTNNSVFDIDQLYNYQQNSFDAITLWHVLEHLPNTDDQMAVFKNLLKQNGVLILAVPNFKSHDALYYKNYWAGFDVPRHLWHFSKSSISKIVERQNMKVIKTIPMFFDAYYVSLLSEKYKTGSLNPFKAFWTGLISNLKAKRNGEYSSLIYIIKNQAN